MKKGLLFVKGWPRLDWLKKVVLSKWFGYGLVSWCVGWLWYDAWMHYKWVSLIQFACVLLASSTLYNQGCNDTLEQNNKELNEMIERTKKRIAAITAPKETDNTWLS